MRTEQHYTSKEIMARNFSLSRGSSFGEKNDRIVRVKAEAEKLEQQRLNTMRESLTSAELRLREQRQLLDDKIALNKMQRSMQLRFKTENVER